MLFIVVQEFSFILMLLGGACTVHSAVFLYFFYVSQTVVVETEVSLCRLLAA